MPQLHKHFNVKCHSMRHIKLIFLILFVGLFSFIQHKEKTGKELFKEKCSSCHSPTQTLTAPPFQKVAEDYGLDWTIEFVNNPDKLFREKEAKALYSLYMFGVVHPPFKDLTKDEIVKILNYVDSFPYDSSKYLYRKLSDKDKRNFIDSIQSERKEESGKLIRRDTLSDSIHTKSGYSNYGVDTALKRIKKPRKRNGT